MIIGIDCSRAFVKERTGTENYNYQVVSHLLRVPGVNKHQLVLFIRPGAILPQWTKRKNVETVEIKLSYLWTQLGLAYATWKRQLDLLWVPAHTLPILRKPGLKTMVTIHGLEYRWLPEYRNLLQRWYLPLSTIYAARSATRLLAVSEHTREEIVRELRVEPSKIAVVPEGVSLENSGYSGGDLGRHGLRKGRYILFIGSLQPRKNLPALVEAFALFGRARSDWKLVIAGGKGWMTEEVFSAPARAGVQERVVFTGRVSEREKLSLLTNAAMYVQPSLTEGFGLPLLEAMAQGTPVIASDGGALPETAGKAAIVVKLGKGFEKRLAKAMERIADEPKLKSQLAAAGMARAREQSWKKVAEESWQELRNLTN